VSTHHSCGIEEPKVYPSEYEALMSVVVVVSNSFSYTKESCQIIENIKNQLINLPVSLEFKPPTF
jgi:hypothetical protein